MSPGGDGHACTLGRHNAAMADPTPTPLTAATCMAEVLRSLPGFQDHWDDHLAARVGEPADLLLDMVELGAHANALLERSGPQADALHRLFALTERLLAEGDAQVRAAVQGGLLESLLHPLNAQAHWLPALAAGLGPQARAYAQQWCRLTGVVLPGV